MNAGPDVENKRGRVVGVKTEEVGNVQTHVQIHGLGKGCGLYLRDNGDPLESFNQGAGNGES